MLIDDDKKYIVNSYGRFDVEIDHGEGATLYDSDGKAYIDLTSGIGVNSLGYANKGWLDAVTAQLGKYQHCSNLYYSEPGIKLAEKLVKRSGLSKVMFVNSGAEANETAFKIARKYGNVIAPGTGPRANDASGNGSGNASAQDLGSGSTQASGNASAKGLGNASAQRSSHIEFIYGILKGKAPSIKGFAGDDQKPVGRNTIISLKDSFHGRTIAAITATGQEKYHKDFEPFAPGFCYADAGDAEQLEQLINKTNPCALIMEMVQGEGGVITLDREYVQTASKLCRDNDVALIIDEVQTGIGRTGTFFAFQQFGIEPDMVTFAKGIGNGLPIGGVICNEKYADVLKPGDHGCTFGMNPVSCAGANYVVDTIDDAFLNEVQEKAEYIRNRLEKLDAVEETTGLGLMIGITLKDIAPIDAAKQLLDYGVMTLTAGPRLRMLPPLTITYDEIDKAFESIEKVLG